MVQSVGRYPHPPKPHVHMPRPHDTTISWTLSCRYNPILLETMRLMSALLARNRLQNTPLAMGTSASHWEELTLNISQVIMHSSCLIHFTTHTYLNRCAERVSFGDMIAGYVQRNIIYVRHVMTSVAMHVVYKLYILSRQTAGSGHAYPQHIAIF